MCGLGITFDDCDKYIRGKSEEKDYRLLARIAQRVYGEVKKVIMR